MSNTAPIRPRGAQVAPTDSEQRELLRRTKHAALTGSPTALLALSNYRLADALERLAGSRATKPTPSNENRHVTI